VKKLRLELDELAVDSFATDGLLRAAGTVHGHLSAICTYACNGTDGGTCNDPTCVGDTCNGDYTCQLSCTECNSYYCASDDPSCGQFSCVYTCEVGC